MLDLVQQEKSLLLRPAFNTLVAITSGTSIKSQTLQATRYSECCFPMRMNFLKAKSVFYIPALVGLVSSLALFGIFLGLAVADDALEKQNASLGGISFNVDFVSPLAYLLNRNLFEVGMWLYGAISLTFLGLIFAVIKDRFKIGMILVILLVGESFLLVLQKKRVFPDWIIDYSPVLSILWYAEFWMFFISIIIVISYTKMWFETKSW